MRPPPPVALGRLADRVGAPHAFALPARCYLDTVYFDRRVASA